MTAFRVIAWLLFAMIFSRTTVDWEKQSPYAVNKVRTADKNFYGPEGDSTRAIIGDGIPAMKQR